MPNYVVTATMQDGISDPANAAAAAMQAAADAADNLTASVTKVGPSAQALVSRFDPLTKSTSAYNTAVTALTNGQATLAAALANGTITQDQYSAALAGLQTKVAATRDAMANAAPSAGALAGSMNAAAAAANSATVAHTSLYREVVVLADEMLRGNYARIPGSMLEMAAYSGQLDTIWGALKATAAALVSPIGLISIGAVAAGAALAAMGVSAESQQRQLLALQDTLMATRDDYASMATEATEAAKAVAGQSSFSKTDTTAAAQTLVSVPTFTGTTQQLESLITLSGDLATVWQQTMPQAAKTLASAMEDPGAEAEKLAQASFPGMTQALADSIKSLADGGDQAGAFGQVLNVLQAQVGGAQKNLTPLQSALADLSHAFNQTGADGKSFGQSIGDAVEQAAANVVSALAAIVKGMNDYRAQIALGGVNTNPIAGPTGAGAYAGTTGNVLTSSAGALGIFQLMPATAAALHVNPNDATQNIYGGLEYIQQLNSQFGGNVPQMLAQYGAYGSNVGAASGYISKVQAASATGAGLTGNIMVGSQTMTVAQAIQFWGQTLGLSPNMISLGMQIAQVESGGQQFSPATPAVTNPLAPLPGTLSPNDVSGAFGTGSGVTDTATSVVNQALSAADKAGTQVGTGQAAFEQIQLYQNALASLAAQGDTTSQSVVELQQALQKAEVEFYNAQTPLDKLTNAVDQQIQGNQAIANSWTQGAAAADDATNELKAQQQAQQVAAPGTQAYADAVTTLARAYDELTASQQAIQAAQTINGQDQQLQYLQAEQATLGETAAQRAQDLAVLKEQQDIESKMPDIEAGQKQVLLDNAAAIADSTTQLQAQQQALSDLTSAFTSAFDTIGNAIAQAFVQGEGAAVNWRNVMDSVIEQVIQEFLKLAVLNPLLNSLFGQNNTTLGGVVAALGTAGASAAAGGSGSGGTSLLSYAGDLGTLSSIGNALGLTGSNGLLSSLGLGNLGSAGSNLLSSLGLDNLGSDITGILNTGLLGGFTTADVAAADIGNPLALEAAQEAALTGGQAAGASATIGTALSGVGLGYGAGSLAGGFVQSALNKTGPAPQIGAGVGAAAGAAIGSIIPGVGTLAGAPIGGIAGGIFVTARLRGRKGGNRASAARPVQERIAA